MAESGAGRIIAHVGPSSRRPRTHAARTIVGCGRKISRLTSGSTDRRAAPRRPRAPRRQRRRPRGIDGDQVGLLAGLDRADRRPSRPSARAPSSVPSRSQSSGAERRPRRLAGDERPQRLLGVRPRPHHAEDRELRAARHVRPEPHRRARPPASDASGITPAPMNRFDVGQWATPRAGLGEPRLLPRGEVDRVGEDRPRPEAARPVVDVDVVARLGEQPRDLRDLARVLGHVRLPPAAELARRASRLAASSSARARDREPRRDRVAEPPAVRAVPARDQVAPTLADATARGSSTARSSGRR